MRTPLYDEHVRLNARIVDFHGWDLPVWYTGIVEEHLAVRNGAGLFDVSHMGEIFVSGPECVAFLEQVLSIAVADLEPGQARYAVLLNDLSGIIDDLLTYCIEPGQNYMLCVNASNTDKDYAWLTAHQHSAVTIVNQSPTTAMLALQGPDAMRILKGTLGPEPELIRHFHFKEVQSPFGPLMVSRTGYTGSDGVEIFLPSKQAAALWRTFLAAGATPCGLGARDTLRLEMGYPLHGNDIDETTSPIEAGLMFAVHMHKPAFIGKAALEQQLRAGIERRLTGVIMIEKGIPREGYFCQQGTRTVGRITSGSISPLKNTGIALAYLASDVREGDEIEVLIRSKALKARVAKPPFVSPASTNHAVKA